MVEVSIVYVNWNSQEYILDSIASVYHHCPNINFEIIVVDNDSNEGCRLLERNDIKLIRNPVNSGFGAGCNVGAKYASGKFILFLNPDTKLQNNILLMMRDFLISNQDVGAVGPIVFESDGRIDFGCGKSFPTLFYDFLEHSTLAFRFPKHRWLGAPYMSYWDHRSSRAVETLLGACMMFRAQLFRQLNGFDESFFLYYEEVDLCKRVWLAGFQVYYLHTCRIEHQGKKSTTKKYGSVDKMILQYLDSAHTYFFKHQGPHHAVVWKKMIALIYLVRYLVRKRPVFWDYAKWGLKRV